MSFVSLTNGKRRFRVARKEIEEEGNTNTGKGIRKYQKKLKNKTEGAKDEELKIKEHKSVQWHH